MSVSFIGNRHSSVFEVRKTFEGVITYLHITIASCNLVNERGYKTNFYSSLRTDSVTGVPLTFFLVVIFPYYIMSCLQLYSSPNISRVIKSRRMGSAGIVACMGRGVYRVLVGKPDGKRPL